MRWQNAENNDDITALDFHPTHDHLLLSGGDDGLVSIFDTRIPEEDDSLLQAVNHGPIHKAGFLGENDLYALSSDQNLALHSLTLDDTDANEQAPDLLGDLRSDIPCEYVIDVFSSGTHSNGVVASGSHRLVFSSDIRPDKLTLIRSKSRVELVKIGRGSGLDLGQRIILEGAHGGEVVRSIFTDDQVRTLFVKCLGHCQYFLERDNIHCRGRWTHCCLSSYQQPASNRERVERSEVQERSRHEVQAVLKGQNRLLHMQS